MKKKLQKPRDGQGFECGLAPDMRYVSLTNSNGYHVFFPLDTKNKIAHTRRIGEKILQTCEYAELLRKTEKEKP